MIDLMIVPLETVAVFAVASVALALAPGPDNIFVLTQSALHGRLAGLFVTVGLCTGLLFHTAAVAAGVAAIFATSAIAFSVLKFVGAGYLLYLAWQAFRTGATSVPSGNGRALDRRALYLRGVIMNITNPKVAIFFLAFLPQFADPARGALTGQIVLFGAVFIVATFAVFGLIAWFAGALGDRLRTSPKAQTVLNRIAGLVFVGLALRLATTER